MDQIDIVDEHLIPTEFDQYGSAIITVRFENRVQWQKWRKYIMREPWEFDGGNHPYTAALELHFSTAEDVEHIVQKVVQLMQMGFDVYSCQWKLLPKNVREYTYTDEHGQVQKFYEEVESHDAGN